MPRRKKDDAIEVEALRLYDLYNPHPDVTINVSKEQCIREAKQNLAKR